MGGHDADLILIAGALLAAGIVGALLAERLRIPGLLLVSLGMGLYLCSVTVNQACIAQGQVRRASVRWITCAALFIGWNFVPLVSNEFRRVEIGFLLAAGVLFSLLYYVYRRPHGRAADVPAPGSGEELEARLAMIDENV